MRITCYVGLEQELADQLFDDALDGDAAAAAREERRRVLEQDYDSQDEGDFIVDDTGGMYTQVRCILEIVTWVPAYPLEVSLAAFRCGRLQAALEL